MFTDKEFESYIESVKKRYVLDYVCGNNSFALNYYSFTPAQIDRVISFITETPQINELTIDTGEYLIGENTQVLANFLRKNASLRKVTIYGEIDDNVGDIIVNALKANTNIQSITFSPATISYNVACSIASLLQGNSYLHELDLSQNDISNGGIAKITEALQGNYSLRKLNLSESEINYEEFVKVMEALLVNSSLYELDLSDNEIGDQGAILLGRMLKINNSLQKLVISNANIGSNGGVYIAEALFTSNKGLKVLDIRRNHIDDAAIMIIGLSLIHPKSNNVLEKLFISNNEFGSQGFSALALALRCNSALKYLDVGSHLGIDNAQVEEFAVALKVNKRLNTLDLIGSNITDKGAVSIANALESNSVLKELSLCNNKIGGLGFSNILNALQFKNTLNVLDMSCNEITGKDIDTGILVSLTNNPLRELNFNWNKLGDEGGKLIAGICKNMGSLQHLSIRNCGITKGGLISILETLKYSQSLSVLYIDYFYFNSQETEKLVETIKNNILMVEIKDGMYSSIDFILQRNKGFIYQIANKLKSVNDVDNLACNPLWFVKSCNSKLFIQCLIKGKGQELAQNIFDAVRTKKIITVEELMIKLGVCKKENALWESDNSLIIFPTEIISKIFIEAFPRLKKCIDSTLRWTHKNLLKTLPNRPEEKVQDVTPPIQELPTESQISWFVEKIKGASKRESEEKSSCEAKKSYIENEEVVSFGEGGEISGNQMEM